MTKSRKQIQENMAEAAVSLVDEVKNSFKQIAAKNSKSIRTIEDMVGETEKVDVKVFKKNAKDRWILFETLKAEDPAEIREKGGSDVLCKEIGGGGEYYVEYRSPQGTIVVEKNIFIGGPSFDIPKSQREANTSANASILPTNATAGIDSTLLTQVERANQTALATQRKASDDIVALMIQQQQNMLQAMMMNNQKPQESAMSQKDQALLEEVKAMRNQVMQLEKIRAEEKLATMQQQYEQRMQLMQQQIQDTKQSQMFETLKLAQDSGSKGNDIWLQLMALNREDQKSQQTLLLELMKQGQTSKSPTDEVAQMQSVLMTSMVNQLQIVGQVAEFMQKQSGGDDHPVLNMMSNLIGGVTNAVAVHMENKATSQPTPSFIPEMAQPPSLPASEGNAPWLSPPQALPETNNMNGISPVEGEEEEENTSNEEADLPIEAPDEADISLDDAYDHIRNMSILDMLQEVKNGPKELKLPQGTFTAIKVESALMKALERLESGADIQEVTARIYGHSLSGNKFAISWMKEPLSITAQVLQYMCTKRAKERAGELVVDIIQFSEHLEAGKDPNEWSPDYSPVKQKNTVKVESASQIDISDKNLTQA